LKAFESIQFSPATAPNKPIMVCKDIFGLIFVFKLPYFARKFRSRPANKKLYVKYF